jgi:hypothetical protein
LRIFDITGALVYEADLPAGGTEADWDLTSTAGDPQPNGLYLCRLTGKNAAGKTIRSQVFKLLIDR